MQRIARQLVGSHRAHQWFDTAEAATQQRQTRQVSAPCSVAEWIEQIQMLWANGAESRLELASLISTIRNHLRQRRGDWSSLWESGELPFSKRKAEKLVVVGDGLGWAINANACSHLPTEWNALYYIARLRRSVQERLIQERAIRPTLSVSQARELFVRFHGVTLKNSSRKTRFRERLRRFEDFFHAELPNCSQAEKNLARARLTGLIELIDEDVPLPNEGPIFPVSITHIRIERNANDKDNSSPSLSDVHGMINLGRLSERSDWLGFKQAVGVLAVALATGALTLIAWRTGHWLLALLGFVAHGNVCSMFISGLHELLHRTVFRTGWLNTAFLRLYSFLYWSDGEREAKQHWSHHRNTLHDDDLGLAETCRPLWAGSWLWAGLFNLPRFLQSFKRDAWIFTGQAALAATFTACGVWELVFLVTLAPFCFGWVLFATLYPQHAGMKLNSDDLCESTRSIELPAWASFLNWRMERHLEHHKYPSVPCYRLAELSQALGDRIPKPQTVWQAWRDILKKRKPGECGYGDNPIEALWNAFTPSRLRGRKEDPIEHHQCSRPDDNDGQQQLLHWNP